MTYDLHRIMTKAWTNYRKPRGVSFPECLHRAWLSEKARPLNEARIAQAKLDAGITEDVNTWSQWRDLGFEVDHGSTALFQTDLIWGSRGDGATYRASFFGTSQVHPAA